ncbi:MAG TPA: SufE family protein [Caulobacteraceae bacterium]|jgi:cysteine desulfuration protein SufE|nr:SufE family protein [Caulobacteraceae bacterium]
MNAPASFPRTIDDALGELEDEFELLGDWEERYRYVIELGRGLEPLDESERSDIHKVRGCASQVWLVRDPKEDGTLVFRGDSDAHIVRGLIAILLRLYSGRTSDEILAFDAPAAFARLGLTGALSQQRANGLASMVQRIRAEAQTAKGR